MYTKTTFLDLLQYKMHLKVHFLKMTPSRWINSIFYWVFYSESKSVSSSVPRQVPLWKQKSGHEDRPVIWVCLTAPSVTVTVKKAWKWPEWMCLFVWQDYHVILLKVGVKSDAVIYDLDSVLPFPCNLRLYAAQALRSDRTLRPKFHR